MSPSLRDVSLVESNIERLRLRDEALALEVAILNIVRIHRGIRVRDVARAARMSTSRVSRLFLGDVDDIPLDRLAVLLDRLDVAVTEVSSQAGGPIACCGEEVVEELTDVLVSARLKSWR